MRRTRPLPLAIAVVLAAILATAAGGRTAAVVVGDSGGAAREGIRVHGAWKLVIRERDGSVVARRAFHNDLTSYGGGRLAAVLARQVSPGSWRITLSSVNGAAGANTGICVNANGDPSTCQIEEPGVLQSTGVVSSNLVLTPSADNAPRFTLSGSVVAKRAASIRVVGTGLSTCDGQVTRASRCLGPDRGNSFSGSFTRRVLPQPLPVAAGQQVQVSVTLSFS